MKMKKKAVIAAAAFAVAMNLSACAYGPPDEDFDRDMPTEETSFAPDENQNVGVYGPPPEEELEYDETATPEEEQDIGEETLNNE